MALVALADFKTYLGTTASGSTALLQACLDAGEQEVLNFCHRSSWNGFEQSTGLTRYYREEDIIDLPYGSAYGLSERSGKSWDRWGGTASLYGGNSHTVLWLGEGELLSVDGITNGDGTTVSSSQYWLEPRNKKPYRYLRMKTGYTWLFDTDGEIEVTGAWGHSTGPDATIINAVKEAAKYSYDLRSAQAVADVIAEPSLGIISVPKGMPKHVEVALRRGGYVRTLGAY